jgi:hypothetical protein
LLSKKIFLFVGTETDEENNLFELTNKGLIPVEDSSKINSRGSICLIYEPPINNNKQTSKYINVSINDITLSDYDIIRENHIKFGKAAETKIFPLKTNKGFFKLSLSIDKEILKQLFMEYEFSKIYPLSIFLWMNNKGVNGIVSENINIFKIVNQDYMEMSDIVEFQKLVYSEEYSENIDIDNISVLTSMYKTNNDNQLNMNLQLMENDLNEIYDEFLPNVKEYNEFQKEIEKSNFYIQDTISAYFKSKFIKPFLLFGIFIFIVLNGFIFLANGKFVIQKVLLENDIEDKNNIVNDYNNKNRILKKGNYWEYLKKYYIKEDFNIINKKIKRILKYQFLKKINIKIISPGKVQIKFQVDKFKEFLILEKYYKDNNIKYKIKKNNNNYEFLIISNLNKEAKKVKFKKGRR